MASSLIWSDAHVFKWVFFCVETGIDRAIAGPGLAVELQTAGPNLHLEGWRQFQWFWHLAPRWCSGNAGSHQSKSQPWYALILWNII
jgi:hypothetical protein